MANENEPDLLEEPEGASEPDDDEQDDEPGNPDDPLNGEEELQTAFYNLYLECCGEDRYPRLIEVKDTKQAELYWGGRQYNWWSESEMTWKLPTQSPNYGDLEIDDMPRFEFVTNTYQATGLTVIGALAGAVPRYRFWPDDPDNSNDIETAAGRTKLAKLIERWNPPQLLMQEEGYHAWTGGLIVGWTRYVADGEKYGIDSVNLLSQGEDQVEATITCPECEWSAPANEAEPPVPCPQCGYQLTDENVGEEAPIPTIEEGETQDIPRGRQVISIHGALEFKRPQHTNHQSEWHYCAVEKERHYSTLRAAYQDKADEIRPGAAFGAEDVFERNARLSVAENAKMLSSTGAKQAVLVTWASIWFRPTAFWMLKDKVKRTKALELFPRGVRVEFAGDTYLTSEAQSMDDALVGKLIMPGRGQHRNGIGTSLMSVQDRLNTLSNIAMETYEYGIPITYRASDTFSGEADDDQRAAPGLEVEVFVQPNVDVKSRIMQTRADSVSPDMQKHMTDLFGPTTQYLSGTFPALTGAGQDQPDTLGQQSMQRDQAMGRMGVFYVPIKQFHADLMTLSCRSFEAHTDGEVKIPVLGPSGDFEADSVDVTTLEGEAAAYPEGDENFPELWNQQRATFMQTMDSPIGMELIKEPGNAELGIKLLGIPGLKAPQIDAWHKQLREIGELTKIPKGDDELLAGIAPNVEVDPKHDDNGVEAACCKWWCNGDVGQKMKRENPMGYEAVLEHWDKHTAAIPAPPPPEKPLAETLNIAFKDMPPEAQAQVLGKLGIQVSPQDFLDAIALKAAEHKSKQPPPGMVPPPSGASPAGQGATA